MTLLEEPRQCKTFASGAIRRVRHALPAHQARPVRLERHMLGATAPRVCVAVVVVITRSDKACAVNKRAIVCSEPRRTRRAIHRLNTTSWRCVMPPQALNCTARVRRADHSRMKVVHCMRCESRPSPRWLSSHLMRVALCGAGRQRLVGHRIAMVVHAGTL